MTREETWHYFMHMLVCINAQLLDSTKNNSDVIISYKFNVDVFIQRLFLHLVNISSINTDIKFIVFLLLKDTFN